MRVPSSLRVYHLLRRNKAPGKKAASTKPRKKRVRRTLVKLWAARGELCSKDRRGKCKTYSLVIPAGMIQSKMFVEGSGRIHLSI